MKNKKFSIIVMLGLLMISGQIWVVQADSSTVQDRALAYIENVLPLHIDKFGIKLMIDGYATDIPEELNTHNISFNNDDKILIYFLGSRVGTMDTLNVIFAVRNNTIYKCAVDLHTGPAFGQSSLKEAVTLFLTRYQTYSGLNTTAMVNMLSSDLAHDATITSGNLTMTIQHTGASSDTTEFTWIYPNGSDYVAFDISFQNNFPVSFYDGRQFPSNPLTAPALSIITPLSVTYQNSSVPLFFGANVLTGSPEIISLSYSLDGNDNTTITAVGKSGIQHFDSQTGYTYHVNDTLTLDNLADGNHTLWVYSQDALGNEMSGLVQFTVDTTNETSTEPVPYYFWFLAALIIGFVLVVSASVLLYRRKQPVT
ncbi:MAG: hypothetical protein WC046_09940 [Candidatus Bathyarchaeia archaeon]